MPETFTNKILNTQKVMENFALDIEAEGFVFKYEERGNHNKAYTKPYKNHPKCYPNRMIDVVYNDKNNWVLICQGDDETCWSDWETMFAGQIKNQQDFKKVLEMVII
jgi:hypothetical protein